MARTFGRRHAVRHHRRPTLPLSPAEKRRARRAVRHVGRLLAWREWAQAEVAA